jgi:hypothetical protein
VSHFEPLDRQNIGLFKECLGLVEDMPRTFTRSNDVGFENARGSQHTSPGAAIDFWPFQPNRASNPALS